MERSNEKQRMETVALEISSSTARIRGGIPKGIPAFT
jgi:hypothetical protein